MNGNSVPVGGVKTDVEVTTDPFVPDPWSPCVELGESTPVSPATWVDVVSGNAFALVVVGPSVVLEELDELEEVEELGSFVVLAPTVVGVSVVLVVDAVDVVEPDSTVVGAKEVEVDDDVSVLLVDGSEVELGVEVVVLLLALELVHSHVVDGAVVVGCAVGPQNWTLEISGSFLFLPWPTFGRPELENWPSYCGGAIDVMTEAVPPFTIT